MRVPYTYVCISVHGLWVTIIYCLFKHFSCYLFMCFLCLQVKSIVYMHSYILSSDICKFKDIYVNAHCFWSAVIYINVFVCSWDVGHSHRMFAQTFFLWLWVRYLIFMLIFGSLLYCTRNEFNMIIKW